MKLSILIPQFMEDESIIHHLLDSIELQQYINFSDIEVLICNDGTNLRLSKLFLSKYNYKIKYLLHQHSGISATRNFLLENSTGDYVMFCDADDMFLDSLALSYVFSCISEGFDLLIGNFYESTIFQNEDKISFIPHINDTNFIHNKVFNKKMLTTYNIKFDESIKVNEDGQFVGLCMVCSEKIKSTNIINYLWKYRKNSTARTDIDFAIKNHTINIKNADVIIRKSLEINKTKDIENYTNIILYQTYCILYRRRKEWITDEFLKARQDIMKAIKDFYDKYKKYVLEPSDSLEKQLYDKVKEHRALFTFEETIPYKDFLEKVKEV